MSCFVLQLSVKGKAFLRWVNQAKSVQQPLTVCQNTCLLFFRLIPQHKFNYTATDELS